MLLEVSGVAGALVVVAGFRFTFILVPTVASCPVVLEDFAIITALAIGAKTVFDEWVANILELNASFDAAEEIVGTTSSVDL